MYYNLSKLLFFIINHQKKVSAIAARSLESSKKFASIHNIPKYYGSYDQLLKDPEIDVVYIGSIADQHMTLATKSLMAGKATVVEKPLALSANDVSKLIQLAKDQNVFFMEGLWTRCFPAMKYVKEVISSGKVGDVSTVQGDFGWCTDGCEYPNHRFWNLESGGMSYDIGMYMIHLGQVAYGSGNNVKQIQAMGNMKHGVDHTILANIMYEVNNSNGKIKNRDGFLQFCLTGEANTEERVVIQGTKGRIIIHPPAHVPNRVTVSYDTERGGSAESTKNDEGKLIEKDFSLPDDSYTTWNYPGSIGFTYQIQDVNNALLNGELECSSYTHEDSLQIAKILDEILCQLHNKKN